MTRTHFLGARNQTDPMKLINALQSTAALSLVALSLTASASAQSGAIGESWERTFGGSTAGVYARADAYAHYHSIDMGSFGEHNFGGAGVSFEAGACLFNHYLEAFYFGAAANVNAMTWAPGSSSASVQAESRLMGFTLFETAAGGTALSETIPLPPYTIVEKSKTFTVGPIPITVSGNLSLGSELGLAGDVNLYNTSMSVTPSARGWVQGTAGVALGGAVAGAGVEATLRVADTTLSYTLTTDIDDQIVHGFFSTVMVPLAIEIRVYAQLVFRVWATVYEWTMPLDVELTFLD